MKSTSRRFAPLSGQDRKAGGAVIRDEGPLGRDVVLHIHASQLETLANGLMGMAEARAATARD